jgi:hypothetical protein
MTSLRDEAHPKFLLQWSVWGAVQAVAIGVLFSAIQLDWYPLAQWTVVFMGVYGLAKVCELALLVQSWWRRMLAVFVIFGVGGLIIVEGIRALQRRSASRELARLEEPEPPALALSSEKPAVSPADTSSSTPVHRQNGSELNFAEMPATITACSSCSSSSSAHSRWCSVAIGNRSWKTWRSGSNWRPSIERHDAASGRATDSFGWRSRELGETGGRR